MKTTIHTTQHETFDGKTVRDLVIEPLVCVAPDTPVSYALTLMRTKNAACLAVTYNRKPVGTFSERNLILATHYRPDMDRLTMEEVMSSPAVAVPDSMPLFDAYALMTTSRLQLLAVVDHNGDCVGIASRQGIMNVLGVSCFYQTRRVSDAMSRTVATAQRGELVSSVLARFAETSISCVVLEHERKPLAVLTDHDLSALILSRADLKLMHMEDVPARPIVGISPAASLDEAIALMNTHETTRLVVVDRSGEIVGLLTEHEAFESVESPYLRAWKSVLSRSREALVEENRNLKEKALFLEQILLIASDTAIIATDLYLKVKYFNEAASMLFDLKPADALGMRLPDLFARVGLEQQHLSRGIDAVQRKHQYAYETDLMRSTLHVTMDCWISGIRAEDDLLSGYVWNGRDVTERRELEENVKRPLVQCKLTGLLNRQSLINALSREIDRSGRYGTAFSVVMFDVDHLRQLNEEFGHGSGDEVLRQIASMISTNIRRVDTTGRLGGGEFLIIAPETTESEATYLAERIRFIVEEHYFEVAGEVTISGSVAQYHGEEDTDTFLRRAEKGLARAKSRGRNRIETA